MGKAYQEIDDRIQRWLERQKVFFVATAPRSDDGLINCSPKGMDGLRVLDPHTLVYADIGGSGIETVAHLRENGRIVIMLCAFDGPPKIFRFYGRGRSVESGDAAFEELAALFSHLPSLRNLVVVEVETIRDSCGYGVPLLDFRAERDSLSNWVASKSGEEIETYRRDNNRESLDGLPGLRLDEA